MKRISLVLVLLFSTTIENYAQTPVIWTVNGDSIVTKDVRDLIDTSLISIQYKTKRNKWSDIDRQEVFSIKLSEQNIQYLYKPLYDGDRSLEQMKLFIDGHRTGYKGSTKGAFLVGFASGSLGMLLPPDKFYAAPLFPVAAVICIGKLSAKKISDISDENFVEGYRQRRKSQNIKSAIWGGLSGMVVGATGSFLIYGWGVK